MRDLEVNHWGQIFMTGFTIQTVGHTNISKDGARVINMSKKKDLNLSTKEWLEIVVCSFLLMAVFLLKYVFPDNKIINNYFSGFYQIIWVVVILLYVFKSSRK
jgi:hypothetical protein